MKFGKILSLYLFLHIFIIAKPLKLNLRLNNNISSLNTIIELKKEKTNISNLSLPNLIENVTNQKSSNIVSKSSESTRFKETEMLESKIIRFNLVEKNMETPVIIRKTSRDSTFHDIQNRVAMDTPQTISNSEGFDAIYKDHEVKNIINFKGLL